MSLAIDSKIQKWGNGLGLRVSGAMRDIPHFAENTPVIVEVFEDGFTVKKANPSIKTLPFSEAQLLAGLDAYTAHTELLAAPLTSEVPE
jgi:antitoxin MazE